MKFTNPNKHFFGINYTTFNDEGTLEYKKKMKIKHILNVIDHKLINSEHSLPKFPFWMIFYFNSKINQIFVVVHDNRKYLQFFRHKYIQNKKIDLHLSSVYCQIFPQSVLENKVNQFKTFVSFCVPLIASLFYVRNQLCGM